MKDFKGVSNNRVLSLRRREEGQDEGDNVNTDRLAQLVERRTTVWEVEGSTPRLDQHSGS